MPTPLSVSSAYLLLVAAAAWPVHAADLLTYDFEQGADLARYPRLDLSRAHASIVVRDKDGKDAKPPRGGGRTLPPPGDAPAGRVLRDGPQGAG